MIVISDVMMPNMNGYALLKKIRHDHTTCKIPVLIVTARPKMSEVFLEIGADSFIAKPINGNTFLSEVDKLVSRVKSSRLDAKKVAIFGKNEKTLTDMQQQLENLGCKVTRVSEEQQIVSVVEEADPDFFFLAVNVETKVPPDLLVHILNTWSFHAKETENQSDSPPALPTKMSIILYEEEKEREKVWISGSEITYENPSDKKALVQKCCKNGALGSIGIYSPQTFNSKAHRFLHQ